MHRFRGVGEELFEVARGLADAVLVLDERDADMAFAILAKAETGRNRDLRFTAQANLVSPTRRAQKSTR